MDAPVSEIRQIIHGLTTTSPKTQEAVLAKFFTHNASFYHPFCEVRSNRQAILRIFQWYKTLSPKIDLRINSIAYDEFNLILYVNITQLFRIWAVPFYSANVTLTTVLQLEKGVDLNILPHDRRPKIARHASLPSTEKFYILSQNDLYQVDQFVRFFLPWGIGTTLVLLWHWFATLCCILGATLFTPFRWGQQALVERSMIAAGEERVTEGLTIRREKEAVNGRASEEELERSGTEKVK